MPTKTTKTRRNSSRPSIPKIDLAYARSVIRAEAQAVSNLTKSINEDFRQAVALILALNNRNGGHVIGTGMGKAGIVAQKVCASLASTGTPALFMHPAEALHGDLGMLTRKDIVLTFSNSGESEEIVRLLPSIKRAGAKIIALTANRKSTLGKNADFVLAMGTIVEPCPLQLAPSASTTAMLALGDALALCVLNSRDFTETDFARLHPGGSLGRKLLPISELMRTQQRLALVGVKTSVGEALDKMTKARGGAAVIVDKRQRLLGIFTDGDFRRLMLKNPNHFSDPVEKHMNQGCTSLLDTTLAFKALEQMGSRHINALPVLNKKGKVVGLLDIQDLVG